jgi:hypothetical protein
VCDPQAIPERIVWHFSWLNLASPGVDQASQTVLHVALLVHLPGLLVNGLTKIQNIKMVKISESK